MSESPSALTRPHSPPSHRWPITASILLVLLAVLLVQLQRDLTNLPGSSAEIFRTTLNDYLSPDGAIPFYRSRPLMRWLINGTVAVTGIEATFANELLQTVFLGAAFILAHRIFRRYLAPAAALGAVCFLAAWMTWGFVRTAGQSSFAYDHPALFFSIAGLYAILLDRRWLLLAIIVMGTWNKETTLWLVAAFALRQACRPVQRRGLLWLCIYTGVFAATYLAARWLFGPTAGGTRSTLMVFWWENTMDLLLFMRTGLFQNQYIVLAPHALALLGWTRFPREFRDVYMGALIGFFPLMFLFGSLTEFRILHEVLPLAALGIFLQAPGAAIAPSPQENPSPLPRNPA